MTAREYITLYNQSYKAINDEYSELFSNMYQRENLELQSREKELDNSHLTNEVIARIRRNERFKENDRELLSDFKNNIDNILHIANRINMINDDNISQNEQKITLYQLVNSVLDYDGYQFNQFEVDGQGNSYLPHFISIVKHLQRPGDYPLFYPLWRNVTRSVTDNAISKPLRQPTRLLCERI